MAALNYIAFSGDRVTGVIIYTPAIKKAVNFLLLLSVVFTTACEYQNTSSKKQLDQPSQFVQITEKPNILFILTDDQTVDTIGRLGNDAIKTPNIDRLAEQGISFSHAYNQGSWSGAVCAASRRMINTGRHLFHTGMADTKDGKHQQSYPLMGEVLQENGYQTFITGKWHLDNSSLRRSFSLGSAVFEGGMSGLNSGGHFSPSVAEYEGDDSVPGKLAVHKASKHTSELLTDAAIQYLEDKPIKGDKPFFMYVAYLAPHDPRQSPQKYVDMYPPEKIELPENFLPEHPFDQGDHNLRDEALLPFPRTEADVKTFIGEYYAMITHLDAQLGRLLDSLERSSYADNTLIVFTSDHGLAVGKHGLLGKQSQYEHSVRAPFIVKGPGVPRNMQATGMFYLHSIFPTILEYAGIEVPDSVEAKSILELVKGERDVLLNDVYGAYKGFQRRISDGRYKLIYYPILKKNQLFDLQNDPGEINDLAGDAAYAGKIVSLHRKLEIWKQRVGDPLKNDDPVGSYENYFSPSRIFTYPQIADPH